MRSSKFVLVATAAFVCALSATAQAADCIRVAALGDGLTHDIAVIMSTHGLANIIDFKGRKGQGAVHTTCAPGSFLTECRSSQMACK
jgi:hypothetical protein